MKINNINESLNFTRAIEVCSDTIQKGYGGKIDKHTMEVIKTIQNKSSVYDGETSRQIGAFLRSQIGDIQKSNVYARRIHGHVYIYTGEEYNKAREIDLRAGKEIAALDKETQKAEIGKINSRRNQELLSMIEDGGRDIYNRIKPFTKIDIRMDGRGRFKSIEYYNFIERQGKRKYTNKILSV